MISSRQDTVTDDVEQRKVESIRGSLDKSIIKKGNPHWQLWQDYIPIFPNSQGFCCKLGN